LIRPILALLQHVLDLEETKEKHKADQ